jgi:signal transduction histidine kinase
VNRVFVPVEENLKDMNDFIHNAGHELKTPLSVIDSNIQMIKESKIYDEKMINELKNEVIKLNSLIDSLVELSNIDFFKDLEELNLKDCIDEVLSDLKIWIKKKKIVVNVKIEDDIFVKADKNYFYIFLSNII